MKNYFITLLLVSSNLIVAQQTGAVIYGEIQSMGMGAAIGADYTGSLIFNNEGSLYSVRKDSLEGGHINEMRKYGTENSIFMQTYGTNEEGFLYYNELDTNTFYSRDIGFSYVKEDTPKIEWTISDETKKVGELTCQKATSHFRGRDYTAWFTSTIPLPYGPWKLQGLPGLILEAYDTNKEIYWYFKSVTYPSEDDHLLTKIKSPDNTWMSLSDYKADMIKSFENSTIGGRMVSESAGIPTEDYERKMLDSYIEDFKIDE